MHIKNYLNNFSSIQSNEKRKILNIFTNLKKSRKSLTKLYSNTQNIPLNRYQNAQKAFQAKTSQFTFNDNLFSALYKHNFKYLNNNPKTPNNNSDTSKMSFKLNYIQNHRPIMKQKIFKKTKQQSKIDSFVPQLKNFQHSGNKLKVKDNIALPKNDNNKFFHSRNLSLKQKQKISNVQQRNKTATKNQIKVQNSIFAYQTQPIRRTKSSLDHYRRKKLVNSNQPAAKEQQKLQQKSKLVLQQNLPDYAKNIMKPCKIRGIQLQNRSNRINKKDFCQKYDLSAGQRISLNNDDKNQWKLRVVKSERQNRQRISLKNMKQNLQKIIRNQQKNPDFEPWNNQINNQQQNEDKFILDKLQQQKGQNGIRRMNVNFKQ